MWRSAASGLQVVLPGLLVRNRPAPYREQTEPLEVPDDSHSCWLSHGMRVPFIGSFRPWKPYAINTQRKAGAVSLWHRKAGVATYSKSRASCRPVWCRAGERWVVWGAPDPQLRSAHVPHLNPGTVHHCAEIYRERQCFSSPRNIIGNIFMGCLFDSNIRDWTVLTGRPLQETSRFPSSTGTANFRPTWSWLWITVLSHTGANTTLSDLHF